MKLLSKKKEERIVYDVSRSLFPNLPMITYVNELKKILKDCHSVFDIGCGDLSNLRFINFDYAVGLDLNIETLKKAQQNKTHNAYYLGSALNLKQNFKKNQFDACVACDVIEHLTKKEGLELIASMMAIAAKKIVIFTPNGFMQQHQEKNHLQDHLSGWTAKEMQKLGFKVIGIFGPKFLRGDQHFLKGPKILTGLLSEFLQYFYTRNHPEAAAAILCVKEKKSKT